MTVTQTNEWAECVENLRRLTTRALESENADDFSIVEAQINRLEAGVRELQQAIWSEQARVAIQHLDAGEELTAQDVEVIKTFLVSDAERYLALENNFNDWVNELNRLLDDISRRVESLHDPNNVADLRGVLKDAVRLVPDIRNYLDEKNRLDRFQQALGSLDGQARQLLSNILKEQLASPTR